MQQKEEHNMVTFEVAVDANKVEIRHAVEKVFNVKVADVRTQAREGKWKRMGRFEGRRRAGRRRWSRSPPVTRSSSWRAA